MKRLFVVTRHGRVSSDYYDNKEEAREARNTLNKVSKGHVISPGPDHWKSSRPAKHHYGTKSTRG